MGIPKARQEDQAEPPIILSDINSLHQCQLDLCNALEKLADQLPDNINTQECLHLARMIYPTVKSAHAFEENKLFPYLTSHFSQQINPQTLDRLHCEHWEDESFACEVQEALLSLVKKPEWANHEALGYMLRGFFEGLRRHIAFERDLLNQLLKPNTLLN